MRRRISLVVASLAACSGLVFAAPANDAAVLDVFKRADASLAFVKVLRRADVGDGLDVVLTLGGSRPWHMFSNGERLGLFIQERGNRRTVYQLGIVPGISGCFSPSIARVARTDTIIWCTAEKGGFEPAQKFVYDVRAKRMVAPFDFEPFTHIAAKRIDDNRVTLTATRSDRRVTLTLTPPDTFTITSDQKRQPAELPIRGETYLNTRFGPRGAFRFVAIPDSETENCSDPVIAVLANGRRHRLTGKECGRIGPNHEVGERLWFGTTFYYGEGSGTRNSGGFGYFDTRTLAFKTFSSREIARWSTSAIYAAGESVWLALESRGEYGNTTGGVLVYPSPEGKPRHIDIGHCVGREFVASGENLYLLTECGVVLLSADSASGYIIDVTTDGRVRVVPGLP